MCLLCAVLLSSAAPPAVSPRHFPSYERWQAPWELSREERSYFAGAQAWAAANKALVMRPDARLHHALKHLLKQALARGELFAKSRDDLQRLRIQAWQQGLTDAQLALVVVRLVPSEGEAQQLMRALQHEVGVRELNRIAFATAIYGQDKVLAAALSYRLVYLSPLPARLKLGTQLTLRGRVSHTVLAARKNIKVTLAISFPDGKIRQVQPLVQKGYFEQRLAVGHQPGILQIQVLIDRGRGPEVAAFLPLGINTSPWPEGHPADKPSYEVPSETDPLRALQALLWGVREVHECSLPSLHAAVQDVAQRHSDDMAEHHFFAHVSPTHGDVTNRFSAAGLRYQHVHENIAAAASIDEVFTQWMDSPSHRANLLAKDVDVFGFGVASQAAPEKLWATLILARLADEGTNRELSQRIVTLLNTLRMAHKLRPLAWDNTLAAAASARSQLNARAGHLDDADDVVDAALRANTAHTVAADVYRSATVDVVAGSQYLAGRFSRIGVGVVQDQPAPTAHLWITVVYASGP